MFILDIVTLYDYWFNVIDIILVNRDVQLERLRPKTEGTAGCRNLGSWAKPLACVRFSSTPSSMQHHLDYTFNTTRKPQ